MVAIFYPFSNKITSHKLMATKLLNLVILMNQFPCSFSDLISQNYQYQSIHS